MYHPPFRGMQLFFFILGILISGGLVSLDYTITNAALPYIAGGVSTSINNAEWFIVSYSMGNAIALSISGFLSQRFGTVRVILFSLLLYLIFSLLCGLAFNLTSLMIFRFLQGFFGGPLIPVAQTLLLLHSPLYLRNVVISIWGLVLIAAPLSAPVIGAYIAKQYDWSFSFFINIPLAIFAYFILKTLLKKRETKTFRREFDFYGFLFLCIFVIALQTILTKGQQWDWWNSNLIRILTVVSLVSFYFLLVTEMGKKEPLMNFRLFKNLSFTLGTVMSVMAYMILFASVAIIPTWLQAGMNYTPVWAGLATLPSLFVAIIITLFLPRLMQHFRKSFITAICFFFFFLSFYWMLHFTTNVDVKTIFYARIIFGCGVVYNTTLIALTFSDITKEKMASASGIFYFFRIFSGAVGTALFTTIWQRRTIYHHFRIIENVNMFRQPVKEIDQLLSRLHFFGKEKAAVLNQQTDIQAMMLAMLDIIYLAAIGCVILIPLVLILGQIRMNAIKKKRKRKSAESTVIKDTKNRVLGESK